MEKKRKPAAKGKWRARPRSGRPLVPYDLLSGAPWFIPFSRKHIRELWHNGLFPPPFVVSANRKAWDPEHLDFYVAQYKPCIWEPKPKTASSNTAK
jgi:hypothetical protein